MGPINEDAPPSKPEVTPTKALAADSFSGGILKLGLKAMSTTATIKAKAITMFNSRTLNDKVQYTAHTVMMACVSIRGQKRLRLVFRLPSCQTCQLLETKTGTDTSAMAWVLLIKSDMTGTANKGKPTPNVPLIKPPPTIAAVQTEMISTMSVLSQLDILCHLWVSC